MGTKKSELSFDGLPVPKLYSSKTSVSSPQSCCPSSQSVASVVPGTVIGAVVVAPNVVMGNVEAIGVVGGAVVVMSEERKGLFVFAICTKHKYFRFLAQF